MLPVESAATSYICRCAPLRDLDRLSPLGLFYPTLYKVPLTLIARDGAQPCLPDSSVVAALASR